MATGKPKGFLKHNKGKKKKEPVLEDADDYLAAAVEDEDAMGKHRGGDAPKSLRFARKALETYSLGLSKYPRNFDLAYNKARLELEVATHPTLVKALDVPVIDLLRQSLLSHQIAIQIDPENADTLFNAAQVLTSLAELIAKDDALPDAEAFTYLEKALEYQEKCLKIQQVKFTESRRIQEEAATTAFDSEEDEGGAKIDSIMTTAFEDRDEEEQWVSVIEPVTSGTLLDTVLAQIATLTALCSILISFLSTSPAAQLPVSLPWIEAYSSKLVADTLTIVMRNEDLQSRSPEAALSKAILSCNLLELAFRSHSIEADTYKSELDAAYSQSDLDKTSSEVLITSARAFIAFNDALVDSSHEKSDAWSNIRWNMLSRAQKTLTTAASLASIDSSSLAETHTLRGDVSLLLYALSQPPTSFAQAVASRTQLLKNAEIFYRNAGKLSGSLGPDASEDKHIAEFRGGVVAVIQNIDKELAANAVQTVKNPTMGLAQAEATLVSFSASKSDQWRRGQLQDMVDEGLVAADLFGL